MLTLFNLKYKVMDLFTDNDSVNMAMSAAGSALAPATGGLSMLLPVASSLLGGIGNIFGQNSANTTQKAIAREQMAWQSEENQKNRDFQTEMWERQNEYNTPLNQRHLLEGAGFNPFVLQQNGSTSAAGSTGSPSMVGAPNMPFISPVNPFGMFDNMSEPLSRMLQLMPVMERTEFEKQKTYSDIVISILNNLGFRGFKKLSPILAPLAKGLNMEDSPTFKALGLEVDRSRIAKDWEDLQYQLHERWSGQEYERHMEILQESVSEIRARIDELVSKKDLNSKTAWSLGAQVAKDLAQAGFFNAQSNQLNSLLPFMTSLYTFQVGDAAMKFQDDYSTFVGNSEWRDFQQTPFWQGARVVQEGGRYASEFIKGFTSIASDLAPLKPKPSPVFNYSWPSAYNNYVYPFRQ